MAGTLANLFVQLGIHDAAFRSGLNRDAKEAKGFSNVISGVSKGLLLLGGAAVVAGGLTGRALLHIAGDFDNMQDTIRVGTGKTGDDLKGLTDVALSVFKSIPTSMAQVGTAITELQQITGATGVTLEDLTRTQLELARVTGTDLKGNIDSTSKAFEQWGVNVNDQSMVLDELFRATQATGVPVATLAEQLSSYGPILRTMGFSLEDSIALLGTMGKAGLDTGVVMAGMKIAFKSFADEGLSDTNQALKDVFTQIQNAPDDLKAGQIAIDTFGGRAGPALANSIRTGKLEYQDLLDIVLNGKDTILDAAADTNDLAENWQIFKNKLVVLVLPAAMALFNFLNKVGIPALTKMLTGISRIIKAITGLTGLASAATKFAKRLTVGFDQISHGISLLGKSFGEGVEVILRGLGKMLGAGPRLIGEFLRGLKTGWAPLDNLIGDVGDMFTAGGLLIQHVLQGEWGKAFDDAVALVKARGKSIVDEFKLAFASLHFGFDIAVDFGKFVWGKVIPDLWAWVKSELGMTELDAISSPGQASPATMDTGVTLSDVAVNIEGWAWGEVKDLWGWIKDQFAQPGASDPMLGGLDTHQAIPIGTVYLLPTLRLAAGLDWGQIAKDIGTGFVGAVKDAVYAFSPLDMANFSNSLGLAIGPAISTALTSAFNAFKSDPVGSAILAGKIALGIAAVIAAPLILPVILTGALAVWVGSGIVAFAAGILGFDIDFKSAAKAIAGAISSAFTTSVDWATDMLSAMANAVIGVISSDTFTALGAAIANGLYDAIKTALKALVPQNLMDWLTADATTAPFDDPRRFQSEASSSPGTVEGGEQVTTLPAVGTGSIMPDFAGMLKVADKFRVDFANVLVGVRGDAGSILGSMREQIANIWVGLRTDIVTISQDTQNQVSNVFVGMRAQLSSLASSTRSAVANEFVGMRNDVASILGGLASDVSSAGAAIGDALGSGIYYGIVNWTAAIADAASSAVTGAIDAARAAAGNPHSPSPVSYKLIGSPIGQGIFKGISDWGPAIDSVMGSIVPYGGRAFPAMPDVGRIAAAYSDDRSSGGATVVLNNYGTIMGVEDFVDQAAPALDRALTDAWRSRRRGLGVASR